MPKRRFSSKLLTISAWCGCQRISSASRSMKSSPPIAGAATSIPCTRPRGSSWMTYCIRVPSKSIPKPLMTSSAWKPTTITISDAPARDAFSRLYCRRGFPNRRSMHLLGCSMPLSRREPRPAARTIAFTRRLLHAPSRAPSSRRPRTDGGCSPPTRSALARPPLGGCAAPRRASRARERCRR